MRMALDTSILVDFFTKEKEIVPVLEHELFLPPHLL